MFKSTNIPKVKEANKVPKRNLQIFFSVKFKDHNTLIINYFFKKKERILQLCNFLFLGATWQVECVGNENSTQPTPVTLISLSLYFVHGNISSHHIFWILNDTKMKYIWKAPFINPINLLAFVFPNSLSNYR